MTNTDLLTGAHTGLGKAAMGRDIARDSSRYATGAGFWGSPGLRVYDRVYGTSYEVLAICLECDSPRRTMADQNM